MMRIAGIIRSCVEYYAIEEIVALVTIFIDNSSN